MKLKTKIYLIIALIILIITLAVLLWSYSLGFAEFITIASLVIMLYLLALIVYWKIKHPSPPLTPEERAYRKAYREEKARLRAQRDFGYYNRRNSYDDEMDRLQAKSDYKYYERERRENDKRARRQRKEYDEAMRSFSPTGKRKPPKFKW